MYLKNLDKENARHIEILNGEMGAVKESIASIETDIQWIKKDTVELKDCNTQEHKEINQKLWWILGTVIIGTLLSIIITSFK